MQQHHAKGSGTALPFAVCVILAAVLSGFAGCAGTDDALQQDVEQLRQDVNMLKAASNRGRNDTDTSAQLDRRIRDLSTDQGRQFSSLSARVDTLSGELTRMANRLDDLSRRLEALSRQSLPSGSPAAGLAFPRTPGAGPAPAPLPLPRGTAASPAAPGGPPWPGPSAPAPSPSAQPSPPISGPSPSTAAPGAIAGAPSTSTPPAARMAPAPAPPSAGAALPTVGSASAPRSTSTPVAEESYQAAYSDLSRGRYELAISGFREFLRRYPDSPQADSAQYNIGESYYSLARAAAAAGQTDNANRALEQAVQEFRKVIAIYPRGAKVPTALYKEALALAELKQTTLAQTRLQYLLDHFPQSEEAPLAKERLASLRQ